MIELEVYVTYGRWYPNGLGFRAVSPTKDIVYELLNEAKTVVKLHAKREETVIIVDLETKTVESEESIKVFIHHNLNITGYTIRHYLFKFFKEVLLNYQNTLNNTMNNL